MLYTHLTLSYRAGMRLDQLEVTASFSELRGLSVDRFQDKRVTAVSIALDIGTEVLTAHGTAVCDPLDKPNPETGYLLALSRATASLGRKLGKRATGQVKHADDLRQLKSARKH